MFGFPDPDLDNAMDMSAVDSEKAAEVLRIAAKYLREHQRLPSSLAFFLADAFDRAMGKASMVRGSELLINLNLKVMNRRPKAKFEHVGIDLDILFLANTSQLEAFEMVGQDYGIDASTVKRMYKKYRELKDHENEAEAMQHEAMHRDQLQ
jgi:hypothetical protein